MQIPLSKAKLRKYSALLRKKERQATHLFLAEGLRLVEAAIASGANLEAIVRSEGVTVDLKVNAPIYIADSQSFSTLSDTQSSQGIIAVCQIPVPTDFSMLSKILFLDNIQDPGNVGTIIRTAAWFGLEAVIANKSVDFYNPKVVRSTMGGIWDIPCICADIQAIKSAGFHIYAADMQGTSFEHWQPKAKSALVLGNEGSGVSKEVMAFVEERIFIHGNQPKGTESLNVAVAAGILMAQMGQRKIR